MIRRIKRLTIALCVWVLTLPIYAQSLVITREFNAIPNSSVSAQYKNEFGRWEKPDLDDTFPYALIRIRLDGNERDVTMAKRKLGLYLGTLRMVLDKRTDKPNELLFLVPAGAGHVEIQCGDGCKNQTIIDLPRLQSNTVYLGHVHYMPAEMEQTMFVQQGPQIYPFKLTVHPAHAKVDVVANGVKQEWILDNGVADLTLIEGKYRYTISAPDYITQEGTFRVDAYRSDTTVTLVSRFGYLTINSDSTDLSELSVEIQQNSGVAVAYPLPLENLRCVPGSYAMTIQKPRHITYNHMLDIKAGDSITLSPVLMPKYGRKNTPNVSNAQTPEVAATPNLATPKPRVVNTMLLAEVGFAKNPEWGVGLMFGQMYNGIGWYAKGRSNFSFQKDVEGVIEDKNALPDCLRERSSEWIVDVGIVLDFLMKKEKKVKNNYFGTYLGMGYGARTRYLETIDHQWMKYLPNSYSGVSIDAGLIGGIHGFTLMAGVNTLGFKYMEIEVGLGWTF